MKKTLLLQSALVAAAGVMLADVASAQVKAEPLSITVGGYFSQFFKVQSLDKPSTGMAATTFQDVTPTGFSSDAEIHFNIRTVLDNGLRIGGRVELEASSYTDQIDERYLFLEHNDWGRMELGSTDKVSGKMLYFAPNSLPGHSTTVHSEYSAAATQPLMWFLNSNHDTEGVNIYTAANRYLGSKAGKGIQLGLSYTPDGCEDFSQATGTGLSIGAGSGRACGANFGQNTAGVVGGATLSNQLSQQYTVAGNYIETFGGVDVALYAAYNSVHVEGTLPATVTDPRQAGWQVGLQLNIPLDAGAAVQVGGGYSKEDVGYAVGGVGTEKRKAYSAGVRYLSNGANPGSWGIGAEYYFRSDKVLAGVGDLDLQYYHAGLTYQMAAGVLTWAGIGKSDLDRPAGVFGGADVNQTFGVIGIGLTF